MRNYIDGSLLIPEINGRPPLGSDIASDSAAPGEEGRGGFFSQGESAGVVEHTSRGRSFEVSGRKNKLLAGLPPSIKRLE